MDSNAEASCRLSKVTLLHVCTSQCCFYLIKARLAEFNCRLLQTNLGVKMVEPKVCRLIGMALAILNHPLTTPLGRKSCLWWSPQINCSLYKTLILLSQGWPSPSPQTRQWWTSEERELLSSADPRSLAQGHTAATGAVSHVTGICMCTGAFTMQ